MKNSLCLRIILLLAALWIFSCCPGQARYYRDDIYECIQNLTKIQNALDQYARDNQGAYPPSLSYLVPRYMQEIPACPSVGIDTYSCGYQAGPKEYRICCFGKNHKQLSDNLPAYDSKLRNIPKNPPFHNSSDSEKSLDAATSLLLLGIMAVVSFLTYRKK